MSHRARTRLVAEGKSIGFSSSVVVKSEGIWGGGTKDANRTTSKWKFDYQDEERSRYKGGGREAVVGRENDDERDKHFKNGPNFH